MALFIYPHTPADLDTAIACSKALDLPPPVPWGTDCLHVGVLELVSERRATADQGLNDFDAPVIILAGLDREGLHRILRWYKALGQWPIFATLTGQSLKMTLNELLGHLLQDRAQEAAGRNREKK